MQFSVSCNLGFPALVRNQCQNNSNDHPMLGAITIHLREMLISD